MSTTNRAFIKAYRHDAAQQDAGVEPIIAAENTPSARVANAAAMVAAARSAQRGPTRAGLQSAPERRPLSSFLTHTSPIEEAGPETSDDARTEVLRPGTTVASFEWPAVCRVLLQQSGPQLDHVIRIMLARAKAGNSLLGVLGMFPRGGATTAALCLASRAAGQGQRVILADGNFRSPRLASLLEAAPTAGWEEVLKHSAPLADAVIHATEDRLDLLALGKRPVKDPQPLVGGLQAAVTAGVLRHAYDLVIVDLGTFFDPVSQPTVIELISNLGVDATVAIAGPEPADPRDLATITEHLGRSGCELLGVIENRVPKPKAA